MKPPGKPRKTTSRITLCSQTNNMSTINQVMVFVGETKQAEGKFIIEVATRAGEVQATVIRATQEEAEADAVVIARSLNQARCFPFVSGWSTPA